MGMWTGGALVSLTSSPFSNPTMTSSSSQINLGKVALGERLNRVTENRCAAEGSLFACPFDVVGAGPAESQSQPTVPEDETPQEPLDIGKT